MANYYWTPIAQGTSGTNVGTEANPFRGFKKVSDEIAAGNISGGDNVYRVIGSGPLAMGDREQFTANSTAVTAAMSTALNVAGQGPMAGTSFTASSLASGIRFFMQSTMADPAIDGRNITTNAQRMQAVLRLRGEDIEVHDLCGYAGDWNYIRDGSGNTRIAGTSSTSDAEDRSQENIGLMIVGNGNRVSRAEIDGNSKHCRAGIYMAAMVDSVAGASTNKLNIVEDCEVYGANGGISVQPQGGGWDLKSGQRTLIRRCYTHSPCWGREGAMAIAGYNALAHGNGIVLVGKYWGGGEVYDCEIEGQYQDALVLAGGTSLVGRDNYIHDVGQANTYQLWQWNTTTSTWNLSASLTNPHGNGIKAGLNTYDGTSPTTWLGTDGSLTSDSSNQLQVPEVRTLLVRNRIYRCRAFGIATNNSRGTFIHANEIDDTGNSGIVLQPGARVGNYWVSNNFVRKNDTEPSNFALEVLANSRVALLNNIFWSNINVSTQRDIRWNTALSVIVKDKNLLVTGRTGGTGTYPTTGDLTPTTPNWTLGDGTTTASLIGVGSTRTPEARSYGASRKMTGRLDNPPNLGPY